MTFIRDLHSLRPRRQQSVLTIGSFDGVHIGHQRVLASVKQQAQERCLKAIAMTFEPQPREYFSAEKAPARLMRFREKMQCIFELGIDEVVCVHFNQAVRRLSAEEFVRHVIVEALAARCLVIGDDFRFGNDRRGNYAMLVKAGDRYGFEVSESPTVEMDGQRVSSTLLREIIGGSDFDSARKLLGRPFAICGRVVYGQCLGAKLGWPTANVLLRRYRAPVAGVFAVRVHHANKVYMGAANVGVRPTLGDLVKPILEVHILDFKQDIYGDWINVEFVHKIREEQKFGTLDELIECIERDVAAVRNWFAGQPN